eukprot:3618988-Pyramimonas_sp.AAC.1
MWTKPQDPQQRAPELSDTAMGRQSLNNYSYSAYFLETTAGISLLLALGLNNYSYSAYSLDMVSGKEALRVPQR